MKKLQLAIRYIMLIFLFVKCVSAGQPIIKSYSGMHANEELIEKAIKKFWEQNPENRVSSYDIQKVKEYFPRIFNGFTFNDSLNGDTILYVFQWSIKTKDYYRRFWYIKSSDDKIIFNIGISNCGLLTGNCELSLIDAMFLNKIENNFRNWELNSQEQKEAKELFEKDILRKLKIILRNR
jgi:hypothetical protein